MKVEEAKKQLKQFRTCHSDGETIEFIDKIQRIEQPYRDILTYRYALTMTWNEVTRIMIYSSDHLRGYMNKRAVEKYASIN